MAEVKVVISVPVAFRVGAKQVFLETGTNQVPKFGFPRPIQVENGPFRCRAQPLTPVNTMP